MDDVHAVGRVTLPKVIKDFHLDESLVMKALLVADKLDGAVLS